MLKQIPPAALIPRHLRVWLLLAICLPFLLSASRPLCAADTPEKPNILFVFIDDMGYADPSCYGNDKLQTPHIDKLAAEGIKFEQFYVNSPVCSPSRVAMTTGQYPGRWDIHSYLSSRQANKNRNMADFLPAEAPSLARRLKKAGYTTAHFGKWHMGGGRDVDNAPLPRAFGFDVSSVAFEGLGDRVLFENHGLSRQSAKLRQGDIRFAPKHKITEIRVNQTIDFIRKYQNEPFYINLWLNDVHDPHLPRPEAAEEFAAVTDNPFEQKFFAVLKEMDLQLGRLFTAISSMGLDQKTLIIFTSDNGPTDWPHYYKAGHTPPGSSGPFFGRKWSLYEGGIRMPFIVRWPGKIPPGKVNEATVLCGVDLFPSLCTLAGADLPPDYQPDGRDMSRALLGHCLHRREPIFWYYPNQPEPGKKEHVSPTLAVREGDWKLLINPDGSDVMLYNLADDPAETHNLADKRPHITRRLTDKLLSWISTL